MTLRAAERAPLPAPPQAEPVALRRAGAAVRRALRSPWAPRLALILVLSFSVAAKSIDIGRPCTSPCKAHDKHELIFDEQYYVNAARVIAGIQPPHGAPYHGAPAGDDPNAEHPQLAKVIMAGGIKVFGDTPLGWRIGSIVFGAIALLALFALVRAAGGSAWLAVGTSAVMALDNLMLVHGRIGTLDIYAVAMMLVSAALYMRRRPLLAGLALGIAACMKEVALSLAFVFVLLEALTIARAWWYWRRGEAEPSASSSDGGAQGGGEDAREATAAGLGPGRPTAMSESRGLEKARATSPVDADLTRGATSPVDADLTRGATSPVDADLTRRADTVARSDSPDTSERSVRDAPPDSPFAGVSSPARRPPMRNTLRTHATRFGIFLLASAAGTLGLLWLLDVLVPAYDPGTHVVYGGSPFTHLAHMYEYAQLLKSKPDETGIASSPLAWLLNEKPINYFRVAVNQLVNGKIVGSHDTIAFVGAMNPFIIFLAIPATFAALAVAWRRADRLAALGVCWCLGTYLPFLIGAEISGRVSYLYYMVIVMPGIYIVTARMFADRRMPKAAALGWAIALLYGFVHLYPLRTLL